MQLSTILALASAAALASASTSKVVLLHTDVHCIDVKASRCGNVYAAPRTPLLEHC